MGFFVLRFKDRRSADCPLDRGTESSFAGGGSGRQLSGVDVLLTKTLMAARKFGAKQILVAGGVSANTSLREAFLAQTEFPVQIPPLALCTDNAAMIASAGYFRYLKGQRDALDLDVMPTWPLS